MYRSAVSNGLAGSSILDTDLYSGRRKLYLLQRPSIDVHNLCIVMDLDEMEDEVKADRIPTHHILAHGCGEIHLGLLITDPDPGNLGLVLEGIEELANNLLTLVEEITPLDTVLLPLLDVDGVLRDTRHVHKILIVKVVREDMIVDGMVLGNRGPDPVDEGADSRVGTNGTEDCGGRHGSLLYLVRICRNEFHFVPR